VHTIQALVDLDLVLAEDLVEPLCRLEPGARLGT
jgi:hypothetical protein